MIKYDKCLNRARIGDYLVIWGHRLEIVKKFGIGPNGKRFVVGTDDTSAYRQIGMLNNSMASVSLGKAYVGKLYDEIEHRYVALFWAKDDAYLNHLMRESKTKIRIQRG